MKRIILIILILTFTSVNILSYSNESNETTIKDLIDIKGHWCEDFIKEMVKDNIIKGYPDKTFKPDDPIKVNEFVVLVLKLLKEPIKKGSSTWYEGVIESGLTRGIISKDDFDDFDRYIKRGEMTKIVINALNEEISNNQVGFKDKDNIPKEVLGYVSKCVDLNIITGYPDNTFKNNNTTTRAEAIVVINKIKNILNNPTLEFEETSSQKTDCNNVEETSEKTIDKDEEIKDNTKEREMDLSQWEIIEGPEEPLKDSENVVKKIGYIESIMERIKSLFN